MKILLIQPKSYAIGFTDMILAEPLGLESIAGGLTDEEVRIIDLRIKDELDTELKKFDPDICGISLSYAIDHNAVLAIARRIKEVLPKAYVVVGGQHASLNFQTLANSSIDAVVIGEGERTFSELVRALKEHKDLREVKGIAFKYDGEFVLTEEREPEKNLDSLPLPQRTLIKRRYYHLGFQRPLSLYETSRGCPYECSFCCVWQFHKKTLRTKSAQAVLSELQKIEEPYVLFVDDNFLVDIKRAEEIAILIKESGLKKKYTFQARSDTIARYPHLIRLWKDIGLKGVFIGFEKVDDRELDELKKRTKVSHNDRALEILKDLGIEVWASFIVDPGYSREDFQKIADYVRSRKIRTPTFSVLTPLPGTKLFEELKEKIVTFDLDLFDIAHCVLPTKLPLPEFYREFCGLYRVSYSSFKLILEGFFAYLTRGFDLLQLLKMLYSAKKLSDPSYYLKAHRL